jgi:hypothetical protein
LLAAYHPEQHPHVLTRRKSPEDVKAEFISAIQRKTNQKNHVSYEAFVDYYAELNFCVPNERHTVRVHLFSILSSSSSAHGTLPNLKIMSVPRDLERSNILSMKKLG